MVLIINGVDVEDFSPPPIGPIPAHYGPLLRGIPNTEPRAPHSYMQRSVFGDEPFKFQTIDPSAVNQPIGPLETTPGVLAPTVTGRPAAKPSSQPVAEPWDHFLYRLALATTKDLGARPHQISDFPSDYPPRDSVETVHPQSQSTVEESVASDVPPSTVEELSFSALPMAPASTRRSSVVEVRAAPSVGRYDPGKLLMVGTELDQIFCTAHVCNSKKCILEEFRRNVIKHVDCTPHNSASLYAAFRRTTPAIAFNTSSAVVKMDVNDVKTDINGERQMAADDRVQYIALQDTRKRRSSVIKVHTARQSSVKIAQATKSARHLGSISGPIRSRQTACGSSDSLIRFAD
ncbi:hypothetical protein CPB85DRAFT_1541370 [Mucidula mucida]|nr:hypothetical protein CPB85DRAFT_1541370 [Mucidula mucida]